MAAESPDNSIGVVIPTLNEEKVIAQNLSALLRDPAITKIVVADGGSTDRTHAEVAALAEQAPERVSLITSAPGRGTQMNAGARQLDTEWLLFHHADSLLPDEAGQLIASLSPEIAWGGFSHRFAPNNWKLSIVSALHNFRCRTTGVVYGDQSMFVRRRFFADAGGFDEFGLEDLQFSDTALERAPSHLLPAYVQTESRKFTQIGEFKALLQVLSIIRRYERQRKLGHESFFRDYR